jgi:arylsulfatase A-like enzyme
MKSSITRRRALAAAAGVPLAMVSPLRAADPKPNIVYMMADDMGYADLSCYGRREFRTPNIDGLAASGVRFLQAYANSSVCSATRTALITGRYQYRVAVGLEEPIASAARKAGLPASHPTLPSLLKKAGYGTTLIGKWHLGYLPDYSPLKSGYDHFWGFQGGTGLFFSQSQPQRGYRRSVGRQRQGSRSRVPDESARRSRGKGDRRLREIEAAVFPELAFQCSALAVGGSRG